MNPSGLQAAVVLPTLADLGCLPLPCASGAAEASDSIGGAEQKKNSNTYLSTESGEVHGIDEDMGTQGKLDALDRAGFIVHPGEASTAMPTYKQYLHKSPGIPAQDIWSYQPHTRGILHGTAEAIDEDVRWLVAQGDGE